MNDLIVTVDTSKRRLPFRMLSNHGEWLVDLSRLAGMVTITLPIGENGQLAGDPTAADEYGNPVEATFTRREPDAQ